MAVKTVAKKYSSSNVSKISFADKKKFTTATLKTIRITDCARETVKKKDVLTFRQSLMTSIGEFTIKRQFIYSLMYYRNVMLLQKLCHVKRVHVIFSLSAGHCNGVQSTRILRLNCKLTAPHSTELK